MTRARRETGSSTRERAAVANPIPSGKGMSGGMCSALIYLLLVLAPFVTEKPLQAQQAPAEAGALLQKAIEKEDVDGDLKSAMDIYRKVADDNSAQRELRARALLGLGRCDEKLGRQAKQVYEQIVRDYGDQPAAVQARKRLIEITQQEHPASIRERRIEWSRLGLMGPADTDGERAVYKAADNLYFGDLGGRNKRLITSTKRFGWVPCRDFSLVVLDLLSTPTRQHTLGVIKADGTGYRTLIRDDAKNSIFERDDPFAMSCSWDDRNVLLFDFSLKSSLPSQLWIVSVTDGQRRVLADAKGWRVRKAVFSPDGRFVAYEVWPNDAKSLRASRIFIVPVEGGEPHLAYESAQWEGGNPFLTLMDWTADGRNIALKDIRQGKSALFLLPMKDGTATGAETFVRFGNFDDGYTTGVGALIYEDQTALPPDVTISLATAGQDGHFVDWRSLDLNTNVSSNPWASFSEDGTQIVYTKRAADPIRRDVMVRDLATGREREIYRSSFGAIVCQFSSQSPKVFCSAENENGETELITVAVESGAVEKIATFPGSRILIEASRDEQAFYFSGNAWLVGDYDQQVVRWDRTTRQETVVEPASHDRRQLSVSQDGHWMARLLNGVVSVRPIPGGDWKPLASGVTLRVPPVVTPDEKWVSYQTVDSAGKAGIFRVPLAGGTPERMGDLPGNVSEGSFLFSPDGRQILAVSTKQADYGLSILENFVPPVKK